jgi:hypothetical protein
MVLEELLILGGPDEMNEPLGDILQSDPLGRGLLEWLPRAPSLNFPLDSHRDQRRVPNGCKGDLQRRNHQDDESRKNEHLRRPKKPKLFP